MSLKYIRDTYGVPARMGERVVYTGGPEPETGTITGSERAHLRVRIDGSTRPRYFHPVWEIKYLSEGKP